MSSRFSAARPKRAGEAYARAHHGQDADGEGGGGPSSSSASSKKIRFDMRNPSALALEGRDEDDGDDVLDADVIGNTSGAATKRGAVNIDGYDSDSDNDEFNARAETRHAGKKKKKGGNKGGGDVEDDVDFVGQMDKYDESLKGNGAVAAEDEDDDEDADMFAADPDEDGAADPDEAAAGRGKAGKKGKEVRFLDAKEIEGQELKSKSGGTVRLDDQESSDEDEETIALAIEEEGVDEEVGAGGLKKHAPKIDAFNMRDEQEEGAFDEAGNFVRKAVDPDAVHDRWLDGVSKKEMKKAAAAHQKREEEARAQRREEESLTTVDLLTALLSRLERGETPLEALARLGKGQTKQKKVPKWKLKKQHKTGDDAMEVDAGKEPEDPKQVKIKEAIAAITEATDKLLARGNLEIYDTEKERLAREYRNETGEQWVDPPKAEEPEEDSPASAKMWEFRWIDGRDGEALQGPYDGPTMKAWQDAGYFKEGVEFRSAGAGDVWTRAATFV